MGNTQGKTSRGQSSHSHLLNGAMRRTTLNQPMFISMSHQDHRHTVTDELKANAIPAKNGTIFDLKEVMEFIIMVLGRFQ